MGESKISARFITGRSNTDLQAKLIAYQTVRMRRVQIISIYEESTGNVVAWFYDETPQNEISDPFKNIKGK